MASPFATDPKTRLTNEPRQSNLSLNEQTEQRKFLPKKSFPGSQCMQRAIPWPSWFIASKTQQKRN